MIPHRSREPRGWAGRGYRSACARENLLLRSSRILKVGRRGLGKETPQSRLAAALVHEEGALAAVAADPLGQLLVGAVHVEDGALLGGPS
jgi:hypothetical protein